MEISVAPEMEAKVTVPVHDSCCTEKDCNCIPATPQEKYTFTSVLFISFNSHHFLETSHIISEENSSTQVFVISWGTSSVFEMYCIIIFLVMPPLSPGITVYRNVTQKEGFQICNRQCVIWEGTAYQSKHLRANLETMVSSHYQAVSLSFLPDWHAVIIRLSASMTANIKDFISVECVRKISSCSTENTRAHGQLSPHPQLWHCCFNGHIMIHWRGSFTQSQSNTVDPQRRHVEKTAQSMCINTPRTGSLTHCLASKTGLAQFFHFACIKWHKTRFSF